MDEVVRQAVLGAITAAGVREERAELFARLLPESTIRRDALGQLNHTALQIAIEQALPTVPEWRQDGSALRAAATPQSVADLTAQMRFAIGIVDPAPGGPR